ncbi:hypothetical protein V8E36_009635 [Tilletia maclaganii]
MRWTAGLFSSHSTFLFFAVAALLSQPCDGRHDSPSHAAYAHRSDVGRNAASDSLEARAASNASEPLPEAYFSMKGNPARGVNLGGWLVTESWMTPSFYQDSPQGRNTSTYVADEGEWMLSYSNRTEAINILRQHYTTWITEQDFQQMKALGLNSVRLVIPYWTLEDAAPPGTNTTMAPTSTATTTSASTSAPTPIPTVVEPFWFKGQRKHVRNALRWAKQYDLDVVLDLHTAPGSQNGFDNSGFAGPILWHKNPTYYNRTLKCLATLVDWYVNNDDPTYSGVVKAIGVLNEPRVGSGAKTIPIAYIKKFHLDAYKLIRGRVSAAKGATVMPTLLFSDGLIGADRWLSWYAAKFKDGTFKNGTVILDQHLYQAFQPVVQLSPAEHINYTCGLQKTLARTESIVPVIIGEMSIAIDTACGYYPTCSDRTMDREIQQYNTVSNNLYWRKLWEAQQLAFEGNAGGWFMWSWKTVQASQWSYKDSVAQGWIPRNLSERVFVPNVTEVAQGLCVSDMPNRNVTFGTSRPDPPPPVPSSNSTATLSSTATGGATTTTSSVLSSSTGSSSATTSTGLPTTTSSTSVTTSSSSTSTTTSPAATATSASRTKTASTSSVKTTTRPTTSSSTVKTTRPSTSTKVTSTTRKSNSTTKPSSSSSKKPATSSRSTTTKRATSTTKKPTSSARPPSSTKKPVSTTSTKKLTTTSKRPVTTSKRPSSSTTKKVSTVTRSTSRSSSTKRPTVSTSTRR